MNKKLRSMVFLVSQLVIPGISLSNEPSLDQIDCNSLYARSSSTNGTSGLPSTPAQAVANALLFRDASLGEIWNPDAERIRDLRIIGRRNFGEPWEQIVGTQRFVIGLGEVFRVRATLLQPTSDKSSKTVEGYMRSFDLMKGDADRTSPGPSTQVRISRGMACQDDPSGSYIPIDFQYLDRRFEQPLFLSWAGSTAWSPSKDRLFVIGFNHWENFHSAIYLASGELVWKSTRSFSAPAWADGENMVFLRLQEEDDAIYMADLELGTVKRLFALPRAANDILDFDGAPEWPTPEYDRSSKTITAVFIRSDQELQVTIDMQGNELKRTARKAP